MCGRTGYRSNADGKGESDGDEVFHLPFRQSPLVYHPSKCHIGRPGFATDIT
jgi:hypothetical protein